MEEKDGKIKQIFRKSNKNKAIHREIVGMFKKYGKIDPDFYLNMLKMNKFIGIILLGLLLNGCAVYFAVEFDTCSKCTKIVRECPADTSYVDVWDYYGGGY